MEADAITEFLTMSTCHSTVTRNIPKHYQDDSIDFCQRYFTFSSAIFIDRSSYSISTHIQRRRCFLGPSRSHLNGRKITFEVRRRCLLVHSGWIVSSRDESHRLQTYSYGRVSSAAVKNGVSPYLQKLPHSNYIQVMPPPSSANDGRRECRRRSTSIVRTKTDMSCVAYRVSTVDRLDLSSFFGHSNQCTSRAASAPTRTSVHSM